MRSNTTPGVSIQPCSTLQPFSYAHPQNRGDSCFSRRSTAKHMPLCFSARLDVQRRSARKDICATQSEMLKDFSRGIARERRTIVEKPLCVYRCWSYCTSDKAKAELPRSSCPSCRHSLPTAGRGRGSCLHQVQGKSRQEPSTSQDTRELEGGLKAPAKAMPSSPHQPSQGGSHPTPSQKTPNNSQLSSLLQQGAQRFKTAKENSRRLENTR